jgi:hypothetical protein
VLLISYIAVVLALAFLMKKNMIFLCLLFVFNLFVVNYIGIVLIRSLVFPFSLWIIKDSVDASANIKFSGEFASLLEKTCVSLRE